MPSEDLFSIFFVCYVSMGYKQHTCFTKTHNLLNSGDEIKRLKKKKTIPIREITLSVCATLTFKFFVPLCFMNVSIL